MRYFPSAVSRTALASSVFLLTLSGLVVPLAVAADGDGGGGLKDKQKDVQAQIQATQADAEEASKQVEKAGTALAQAEQDLAGAQQHLVDSQATVAQAAQQLSAAESQNATMQAALATAEANLTQAKAELAAGQAALLAQQIATRQSVVDAYQQGSPELMAWTGYVQSATPSDLIRKLEYTDNLLQDQNAVFGQLHDAEVALQGKRDLVKQAEQAAGDQADLAAQQLVAVQDLKAKADAAANDALLAQDAVTTTVAVREKAQRKAERAKKEDLAELDRLKKQEATIKAAIMAAAAKDDSKGYVGNDDGFLLPPVNGAITSPFGYRIHPIYGYWGLHDGTDFGVSCGEGMRAAADGTVIERYYSSVYGNRLYVNVGKVNGHALTVVYNHATSYTVDVGDKVKRGDIVGYVGSTGWSTGCHLHFTVLQDGTAVDPMGYL